VDKQQKTRVIEEWRERFGKSSSSVVVHCEGLDTKQVDEIRNACHEAGVDYHVVKNRLAKLAAEGTGAEELIPYLKGPNAILVGFEDEIAPAKIIAKAAAKIDKIKIIAGVLNGKYLDEAGVKELSKLPGRDELRGQLLGMFDALPGGFVRLLAAVPQGLLNVLNAKSKQLETE